MFQNPSEIQKIQSQLTKFVNVTRHIQTSLTTKIYYPTVVDCTSIDPKQHLFVGLFVAWFFPHSTQQPKHAQSKTKPASLQTRFFAKTKGFYFRKYTCVF